MARGARRARGFTHIAPVLADVMYEPGAANLRRWPWCSRTCATAADGWALALTSLRDLYADAEEALASGDADPDDVGAPTRAARSWARRSGWARSIGEMHLALARSPARGLSR